MIVEKKMAKLSKNGRKLGELVTRKQAIRNFCYECMGYSYAEIPQCCAPECWLFPFRQGAVDEEAMEQERKLAKEQKEQKAKEKEKKEKEERKEKPQSDGNTTS